MSGFSPKRRISMRCATVQGGYIREKWLQTTAARKEIQPQINRIDAD
jgi:hypothetical protein